MAGYDNIKGKGNRFSSTNQPKRNGRKPKLYTIAKKTYNISLEEWKGVAMYLMQCTRAEVEAIANANDTPIWVANICRALHKDAGKGVITTLQELMDRVYGKSVQRQEQEVNVTGRRPVIVFEDTTRSGDE